MYSSPFTGGSYSDDRSIALDCVTVTPPGPTPSLRRARPADRDEHGRRPNNSSTSSAGYDAAGNRSIYATSASGSPSFGVNDAATVEGGNLMFTVVRNGTGAASVYYVTANGTAAGNSD